MWPRLLLVRSIRCSISTAIRGASVIGFPVSSLSDICGFSICSLWHLRFWTSEPSTNLLEIKAAGVPVMAFSESSNLIMQQIIYRIAAAYTRSQGDLRSSMLSQEAFLLQEQAVSRYVTFLPLQWIPTGGYSAADFLSRHNLAQWISLLDRWMFKPFFEPFSHQSSCACTGVCCKRHGP